MVVPVLHAVRYQLTVSFISHLSSVLFVSIYNTETVLTTARIWSQVPEGLSAKTD